MRILLASLFLCSVAFAQDSWEERMLRQLDKRISVDLQDQKLSDTAELLSQTTGLNIILSPTLRQANPSVTLRVQDMDAANVIQWIAKLTETHVELIDQAIYFTDTPSKEGADAERKELMLMAADHGVVAELPPEGVELTDQDRLKVAMQILDKEKVQVQDFPGPEITLGTATKK